jgi:hypothetical protein
MSKKKYIFVLVFSFLTVSIITGCLHDDDDPASKDLFSLWTEDGTDAKFDFSSGKLNESFPMAFFFVGGEICNCDLLFLGTQSSGSWVLNSCVYDFGSGAGDPGCNALNGTGTYSKAATVLTITDSLGVADTYR